MDEKYPQHNKLHAVVDQSQAIGEFIDWLSDEKGVTLAHHERWEGYDNPQYVPYRRSIQGLLAEFFDIDLTALDDEKRAMLDAIRATQ